MLLTEVGCFCCFWKRCASLRAWFVSLRKRKREWRAWFFLQVLFFVAAPPLPKLFCYWVLPFFLAQGRHKNVMCILDKEICDVGTSLPFFFFFCSTCACILRLSRGGEVQRRSNVFWCCSVKQHSCICFDFLSPLIVWWWCWNGAIVWLELLCCLLLEPIDGGSWCQGLVWRLVICTWCILDGSRHGSAALFIPPPLSKVCFLGGTYPLEKRKVLHGRREKLFVFCATAPHKCIALSRLCGTLL